MRDDFFGFMRSTCALGSMMEDALISGTWTERDRRDHSGSWISNLELGDLLHDHVTCTVIYMYIYRAGQAAGGSFKTEKTSTPKKEFAYRLCAGRPTSAMPFRLLVAFWWWLVVFPWCVGGGDVKNHLMWRGEVVRCRDVM